MVSNVKFGMIPIISFSPINSNSHGSIFFLLFGFVAFTFKFNYFLSLGLIVFSLQNSIKNTLFHTFTFDLFEVNKTKQYRRYLGAMCQNSTTFGYICMSVASDILTHVTSDRIKKKRNLNRVYN